MIPAGVSIKDARRHLAKESAKYPPHCIQVPQSEWPPSAQSMADRMEVWRSRKVMVQVIRETGGVTRMSINRSEIDGKGQWLDGLTWDDLQRIKNECGFADFCAVEVFPPDLQLVNVANIRHLWVLPEVPPYVWKSHS